VLFGALHVGKPVAKNHKALRAKFARWIKSHARFYAIYKFCLA